MGSSPRVRGEAKQACASRRLAGIIPAGAGRSSSSPSSFWSRRDHPRGCGEKMATTAPSRRSAGSSPRVRGEVFIQTSFRPFWGIIPAGAGRSLLEFARRSAGWDHPRGCGEKNTSRIIRMLTQGSSPRVRGEVCLGEHSLSPGGIIPAGAGRRFLRPRACRSPGDHPRGCGEKKAMRTISAIDKGSSPRVRGEGLCNGSQRRRGGIIPAGAGRRVQDGREHHPPQDHPRGCGEKIHSRRGSSRGVGSSPRVRGEDEVERRSLCVFGIIPAGAGRSRSW